MSLMKKLNQILFSLLTLLIFSTLLNSAEKTIVGNAKVIDGDTIKINKEKIYFKILLQYKFEKESYIY